MIIIIDDHPGISLYYHYNDNHYNHDYYQQLSSIEQLSLFKYDYIKQSLIIMVDIIINNPTFAFPECLSTPGRCPAGGTPLKGPLKESEDDADAGGLKNQHRDKKWWICT